MNRFRFIRIFLFAAIFHLSALSPSAEAITFTFQGVVDRPIVNDRPSYFGNVALGDSFSGIYTIDAGALDTNPAAGVGDYLSLGSFDVFIGGVHYSATQTRTLLADSASNGFYYRPEGAGVPTLNGGLLSELHTHLQLDSSDFWQGGSDTLPLIAPLLSAFDTRNVFTVFASGTPDNRGRAQFQGTITSLNTLNPVPLPAALPLFGAVLGLTGAVGWWKRRKLRSVAATA